MKVIIEEIPHEQQRYPTVGDWFWGKTETGEEILTIRVSKLSDWRKTMCVAFHELAEVLECKHAGVTQEAVDAFDMEFERRRARGEVPDYAEPGDDPSAPYAKQHCSASGHERLLAAALDVNWEEYEKEIEALP